MKKAAKIMSIISGIFLILFFLFLLLFIGYLSLASVGLGITSIVYWFMSFVAFGPSGEMMFTFENILNGNALPSMIPAIVCGAMAIIVICVLLQLLAVNVLGLVSGILTLVGSGKKAKKGIHIASIVLLVLFLLLGMMASFGLLLFTGLMSFVVGFFMFIVFILALLAHIFALIAIKKEKDEPQQEETQEVIEMEEVL